MRHLVSLPFSRTATANDTTRSGLLMYTIYHMFIPHIKKVGSNLLLILHLYQCQMGHEKERVKPIEMGDELGDPGYGR